MEESNETCIEYNLTNGECLNCTKGYDLYKGICIKYAFNVSYEYQYDFHPNKIFNPEKIKGLLAFRINNDEITEPNSNNVFNNFRNYTVYFYLNETIPIYLSYMFDSVSIINDFSFNKNINKFNIIDMKTMFRNNYDLTTISFRPFQGKDLIDIFDLFSNCQHLKTVEFSSFDAGNLKYMDKLFYSCYNLISVDITNLNTNKVVNMSEVFDSVIP